MVRSRAHGPLAVVREEGNSASATQTAPGQKQSVEPRRRSARTSPANVRLPHSQTPILPPKREGFRFRRGRTGILPWLKRFDIIPSGERWSNSGRAELPTSGLAGEGFPPD